MKNILLDFYNFCCLFIFPHTQFLFFYFFFNIIFACLSAQQRTCWCIYLILKMHLEYMHFVPIFTSLSHSLTKGIYSIVLLLDLKAYSFSSLNKFLSLTYGIYTTYMHCTVWLTDLLAVSSSKDGFLLVSEREREGINKYKKGCLSLSFN